MAISNNPSGINQVGMGVYLDDGVSTLAQLRAIRQEMEAINRLSGRTPAGSSGSGSGSSAKGASSWEQELKAREAAELASMKRLAKARVDGDRTYTNSEINALARQKEARMNANREVDRRARELHRKRLADEERMEKESLSRRRQAYTTAMQSPAVYGPDLRQQARAFQRYRNDPARWAPGDRTNEFRSQLAMERLGQRAVINEQRRAHKEQEYEAQRHAREMVRIALASAQQQKAAAQSASFAKIADNRQFRYEQATLGREMAQRQTQRIREARYFQQAGLPIPESRLVGLGGTALSRVGGSYYRYDPATGPTYGPRLNPGSYTGDVFAERARQRLGSSYMPPLPQNRGMISSAQQYAGIGKIGSTALSGTRSVLGTDFNLGVAGRITRNILLYEAVSEASYGLVNYIGNAITAAKTTVEFANALRFATEQADGNLAQTQKLADSMLAIGLSRQQGRAAVVEAARFAEGRPADIAALTQVGADIAAARGLGIDRTDELIEQLRRRESKFYKRLFGTTVEAIYEAEAAREIDAQGVNPTDTPSLFIGLNPNEIKSRREQIAAYVAAMDDEAKENSVLNYILSQSNKFQGEAAERATTLAGRLDRLSAAWLNGQEGLGLFISDLRIFNDVLDLLGSKVGVFDSLRPPEIGRTGERGTISRFDVQQFGVDRTTGTRANLLSFLDNTLTPGNIASVGALGAFGLLGRRNARIEAQNRAYFDTLGTALPKYGGNSQLAIAEAKMMAAQARPGVLSSIGAGATRFTVGGVNTLGSWFGRPNLIGNRAVAPIFGAGPQYSASYNARGPVVAQGPYSPLINPQLQSRIDQVQGAFGAAGGIAGGVLGYTIASFVADKITANSIVATGISILGGAVGTGLGSVAGDATGNLIGSRLAAIGGFSTLGAGLKTLGGLGVGTLAAGVGSVGSTGIGMLGGLGILGGTALLGGAVGYGIGSYLASPVSRILNLPYAQQLEDERQLRAIEASTPAFTAQTRERRAAFESGRLRFRSSASGAPLGLLTGAQVRELGLSRGSLEEVIVSRREAGNLTREQGILDLREAANRLGVNADIQRTSSLTGLISTEFDPTKVTREYNQRIAEVQRNIQQVSLLDPTNEEEIKNLRGQLARLQGEAALVQNATDRELLLRQPGTFVDPVTGNIGGVVSEEYRARAAERELVRKRKEAEEFAKETADIESGLAKLREAGRNAYQVVGDIASAMVGEDNQYVRILAEQLTLGERMQQQWGFLGKSAVDYFTKLNAQSLNRQLLQVDYKAYERATGFTEQAAREAAAREAPGLTSKRDQNITNIYEATLGALTTFQGNRLNTQRMFGSRFARDIYGDYNFNPIANARNSIGEISARLGFGTTYGIGPGPQTTFDVATGRTFSLNARSADVFGEFQRTRAATSGLSAEARSKIGEMYAGAFFDIIGNLDESQLRRMSRDPGFKDAYLTAVNAQQEAANRRVTDSLKIAQLDAEETDRLDRQLREDENKRQQFLLQGYDPKDVGRASDRLFLARTEGIDPRDLTFTQFQTRQEILKREAAREDEDRKAAQEAVAEGLRYQKVMQEDISQLRSAIMNGEASVLIQIQNDTQARADKSYLDARAVAGPAGQQSASAQPGSPALERYEER